MGSRIICGRYGWRDHNNKRITTYLLERVHGLPDGHLAQAGPVLALALRVRAQLVAAALAGHVGEAGIQQGRLAVVVQQRHVHSELGDRYKRLV